MTIIGFPKAREGRRMRTSTKKGEPLAVQDRAPSKWTPSVLAHPASI
jgi:hypothetical protein